MATSMAVQPSGSLGAMNVPRGSWKVGPLMPAKRMGAGAAAKKAWICAIAPGKQELETLNPVVDLTMRRQIALDQVELALGPKPRRQDGAAAGENDRTAHFIVAESG
jgi:hypothetical protein